MQQLARNLGKFERISVGLIVVMAAYFALQMPASEARLLGNTLQLGLATLVISLPIGGGLACALTRCHVPLRSLWEGCLLLLLFMPLYIQLAAWEAGFGRGGWYSLLIAEKLSNPPLDGFRGAVWVHAMAAVPWLFWIFRLGLLNVPSTYEEAARLDATPRQVFRHIVLPLCLPALFAGALYVLIVTATEITVTDRYQFRSYAEVLYNEFVLNTRFDELPLGVAPIVVNMTAVIVLGLAACRLLWPTFVHATVSAEPVTTGRTNWLALGIVSITVSLLLLLPIGNLLYQAGIEVRQLGDHRVRVWSVAKAVMLCLQSPITFSKELAWTALMSQLSTITAVTLATLCSWWALRRRSRQLGCTVVGVICFVTPGPFISLALIWLLNRDTPPLLGTLYAETIFASWLALTVRCFPFALLLIFVGLRTIPSAILDAARTDGADALRGLWYIALPLIQPSLICAAVVCLAVCVGELSASALLLPPDVDTVASRIFQLIHYGAEDELAGLCLSCLALMAALSWLARGAFRCLRPRLE